MAASAQEVVRFRLPARIRVKQAPDDSIASRLALADRIADLPGIETVEGGSSALPSTVSVFLRQSPVSLRKPGKSTLLCTISAHGISVQGLNARDRHQVLSRGWGHLDNDAVVLFLPRDEEDLAVCWDILQRAYNCIFQSSAVSDPVRITVGAGRRPRFSRTTLQ